MRFIKTSKILAYIKVSEKFKMIARTALEQKEREWLASYALKSGDSKGRVHSEKEHDFRTAYQRDRDRIVHSTAFRRL